jgi:hypothetical protein
MILALKGLQWPVSGARRLSFADRDSLQIARCETFIILRPFRTGRKGGGFPGINPWAESSRPAPAGLKAIPHRPYLTAIHL